MTKARKKGKSRGKNAVGTRPARRRALIPEIIRMILQYFAGDKPTLRACSQTARVFRHTALSLLGRHITINNAFRLRQFAQLIARGAFQHVRSLDLGVDNKDVVLQKYWRDYIIILRSFAQYRSLNRLWLSNVPFTFAKDAQKRDLREAIVTLGSTVNELGLYGCRFSSYEEMISLIRSFPLCNFLFIRNCITEAQVSGENALAGLRGHKLTIKDLQLCASSSKDFLIDVSNLIEDAALDIGSLTSLTCDFGTPEKAQRVAAATTSSPVEQFQVACRQPGGFQAFVINFSKWTLTSLTIGPQAIGTDARFWREAFEGLPLLPSVCEVTIVSHRPTFTAGCWEYFDSMLARRDLFPALRRVYLQASCRTRAVGWGMRSAVSYTMPQVRRSGIMFTHC